MKFDTEGTYTLQYKAVDECGNETIEDRTVDVVSLRTVLYTDGTFIINEKSSDINANVARHGAATNVYAPLDPNGAAIESYYFPQENSRPWHYERSAIQRVEIGDNIKPKATRNWFYDCSNLISCDFDKLDTSEVTTMYNMFNSCSALTNLDLSNFDTSNVTDMANMFSWCSTLASLDISGFNTSNVTTMSTMFSGCSALTNLDLSSFDTSKVTNTSTMFRVCSELTTIFASDSFVTTLVSASVDMFDRTTKLTGGAGTRWSSSNANDATYAHIDGGTASPGYFTLKQA